jgi:hypothetical protein
MTPQAARIVRIAVDVLLVVAVTLGVMKLFEFGLQQLATTQFWKTWSGEHSVTGRLVPTLGIAVACGFFGGLVLGGFAGGRALRLAYWTAAVVLVVDCGATLLADGIQGLASGFALAPLGIAVGLIPGAALGGKLMPSAAE